VWTYTGCGHVLDDKKKKLVSLFIAVNIISLVLTSLYVFLLEV
jgi:hypothetical protein